MKTSISTLKVNQKAQKAVDTAESSIKKFARFLNSAGNKIGSDLPGKSDFTKAENFINKFKSEKKGGGGGGKMILGAVGAMMMLPMLLSKGNKTKAEDLPTDDRFAGDEKVQEQQIKEEEQKKTEALKNVEETVKTGKEISKSDLEQLKEVKTDERKEEESKEKEEREEKKEEKEAEPEEPVEEEAKKEEVTGDIKEEQLNRFSSLVDGLKSRFTQLVQNPAEQENVEGAMNMKSEPTVEQETGSMEVKGEVTPEMAEGGWIEGPQSGYPVSLDGKGVDFIGHGKEYVSKGPAGSAFIVPFDTPATRKDPDLTGRRMQEASKLGFSEGGLLDVPKLSIPTFSEGGLVPFNQSLPHFSTPQFSTGGVLNVSPPSIPKFDLPDVKPPVKGFSEGGVINNFNVPPLPSLNIPSPIQQFAQGGQYTQTYSPNISTPVSPNYSFATGGVLPKLTIPKFDEGGVTPPAKGGMGQLFQIFKDQTKLNVIGKMINKVKGAGSSIIQKVTQGRNSEANKTRDAMMAHMNATAEQVIQINEQNVAAISQANSKINSMGGGGGGDDIVQGMPGQGTYLQNGVLKTTASVLNSNNNFTRGVVK